MPLAPLKSALVKTAPRKRPSCISTVFVVSTKASVKSALSQHASQKFTFLRIVSAKQAPFKSAAVKSTSIKAAPRKEV